MKNRLDEASSPYLRQHADNPVAWQPWDDTARDLAAERDVPIFLSIGYAACHWCHVMEDESFSDPDVADALNRHFVPVKVDREERPDVDSVYMTVCQMVRGTGGWPLSVWLTPDGRPFHVGTYFPPEPTQGMPGFHDILTDIAASWTDPDDRAELEARADNWTDALTGELEATPDNGGSAPDASFIDAAASAAVRGADREYGGWGRGQKFPQPGRLHVLFRAFARTGRAEYRSVATDTLDAMASGGLYDHVGGGFHRYCVDREWTVPHFEKMLYDNAEIPRAFLAGYQVTGKDWYADVVRETFTFIDREFRHPEGGFYATLDAESKTETGEREEGAFYVWTPEEIEGAVDGEQDAALFCDRYGITEAGNFDRETTVLTRSADIPDLADTYGFDQADVRDRLAAARDQVLEARTDRPRPMRDEKILAGWNGLMISALAEAGIVLDEEYADVAATAVDFCRETLWDSADTQLYRRYKDGNVGIRGYLEDYAFLGRGVLDAYQATGDPTYLEFALTLARSIRDDFYDRNEQTLYFTPVDGESLVARPQELTDASTPASTGVAVQLLESLSHASPDDGFAEIADAVLETHATTVESNPLSHASLALAADTRAVGSLELTIAADHIPPEWRDVLSSTYLPTRFLTRRPPTQEGVTDLVAEAGLSEIPPIWANREAIDAQPTVYACRSFSCSPPQQSMAAAIDWATTNTSTEDGSDTQPHTK